MRCRRKPLECAYWKCENDCKMPDWVIEALDMAGSSVHTYPYIDKFVIRYNNALFYVNEGDYLVRSDAGIHTVPGDQFDKLYEVI